MSLEKKSTFHHSVTELGNIQVREVTEYLKDGKVVDKKYGDPMTPADTQDMTGWDDRSKDIVAALIEPETKRLFHLEFQAAHNKAFNTDGSVGLQLTTDYDRVIEEDGKIAVRRITRIFDEGKEVSKKYHRSWIMPGDNSDNNDVISKALAKKLHTRKVIKKYKAVQLEKESKVNENIKVD